MLGRSAKIMSMLSDIEFEEFHSAIKSKSLIQKFVDLFKGDSKPEKPKLPIDTDPSIYSPCCPNEQLKNYQSLLNGVHSIYVFRNGTAVYSDSNMDENTAQTIMEEHGFSIAGTRSADFHVGTVNSEISGFVVKYDHPSIISFASFEEYGEELPFHTSGSLIRTSRDMDSYDLQIVSRYNLTGESDR